LPGVTELVDWLSERGLIISPEGLTRATNAIATQRKLFTYEVDRLAWIEAVRVLTYESIAPAPTTPAPTPAQAIEANEQSSEPPAIEITEDAIECSQAKLAKFRGQSECGGLAKRLKKRGILTFAEFVGGKLWVVFKIPQKHAEFRAFMEEHGKARKNVE
jgi:hypothetical protein